MRADGESPTITCCSSSGCDGCRPRTRLVARTQPWLKRRAPARPPPRARGRRARGSAAPRSVSQGAPSQLWQQRWRRRSGRAVRLAALVPTCWSACRARAAGEEREAPTSGGLSQADHALPEQECPRQCGGHRGTPAPRLRPRQRATPPATPPGQAQTPIRRRNGRRSVQTAVATIRRAFSARGHRLAWCCK